MIGYIKGKVLFANDGVVLLENNGIGYEINCSAQAFSVLTKDRCGEVFTYMAVREDGISLYGFISMEEKNMFLKLISVSGVGPKMGICVLSSMDTNALTRAIITADIKTLSLVKGLGKKTAERIVLELKDKVCGDGVDISNGAPIEQPKDSPEVQDAVSALVGLGFSANESLTAVRKAIQNGAETVQQMIAIALKNIR